MTPNPTINTKIKDIQSEKSNKKGILYAFISVVIAVYSAILGDVIMSIVAACTAGGFFAGSLLGRFKVWLAVGTAVVLAVACVLLGVSLENYVLAFAFFPLGFVTYFSIKRNASRATATICGIVALLLFYAGYFAFEIYQLFGGISMVEVQKFIELNFSVVRSYMQQLGKMYLEQGFDAKLIDELFSAKAIDEIIKTLRVAWLGYAVCIFGVAAFASSAIAIKTADEGFVKQFRKENGDWSFVLSKMGASVFLGAYLAARMYSPEKEGLYLHFALNTICLGMYPALLYMGGRRIIQKLRSSSRISLIIGILIAISIFGEYALLLLVIMGIFNTYFYKEKDESENK